MNKLITIFSVFMIMSFLSVPVLVYAQIEPLTEEVTADNIIDAVEKAYKDWKSLGWMYGIVAAIGVVMLLLRFRRIDQLMEEHGWKQYKPYFAMGLGAIAGFFTELARTGIFWPDSIMSLLLGLIAGMSAVGMHQFFTKGNSTSGKK